MNELTIEPAPLADAAPCAAIFRASRQHSLPYLPVLHTAEDDRHFFTDRVFSTDTVMVAREEGRGAVGFIAFADGWVNHLYVLPEFQGLGIGRSLLEQAKESSPVLNLWTFTRNEGALRFFERQGFSIIQRTD